MNIVFACGNHQRHFAIASALAKTGWLSGLVIEQREAAIPQPPSDLDSHLRNLFVRHFEGRSKAEQRFFGDDCDAGLSQVDRIDVSVEELNGSEVQRFLTRQRPDVFLSYGVHKLSETTLDCLPGYRWNIHGGLSPWYRGCITHFWPSYLLEPQMTGMTVHNLTNDIDGGEIVHQAAADLVSGDGLHDLGCRAVRNLIDQLPELMSTAERGSLSEPIRQKTTGRIWRARDWHPSHLKLIYDLYDNRIVDMALNGELPLVAPKLVTQFEDRDTPPLHAKAG